MQYTYVCPTILCNTLSCKCVMCTQCYIISLSLQWHILYGYAFPYLYTHATNDDISWMASQQAPLYESMLFECWLQVANIETMMYSVLLISMQWLNCPIPMHTKNNHYNIFDYDAPLLLPFLIPVHCCYKAWHIVDELSLLYY